MSGEPTDPARATIPDSGADVNTPLTLHREEVGTLAYMDAGQRDAIVAPLFGWLAFGEWNPPVDLRARSIFDALVHKHEVAVANHRENSERQRRRIMKRWHKTNTKDTVVLPRKYHGNTTVIPTTTNTTTNTNTTTKTQKTESESDTRTEKGVQGERAQTSKSGSESVDISPGEIKKRVAATGRLKIDPWRMMGDEVRYGKLSAATILRIAFGDGGWRTAVEQAGEEAVRELFLTFRSEMRAGEVPQNPAAAFTDRLKQDLGVDFTKTRQTRREDNAECGSGPHPSASVAKGRDPFFDLPAVLTNVGPQKTRRAVSTADRERKETASIEQRKKEALAKMSEFCRREGVA